MRLAREEDSAGRKVRADAERNRERLLQAAKIAFSAKGSAASLEEIAREAGVGIGTLYRHFPTRDALIEAVYRNEAEQLFAAAEQFAEATAGGGAAPMVAGVGRLSRDEARNVGSAQFTRWRDFETLRGVQHTLEGGFCDARGKRDRKR